MSEKPKASDEAMALRSEMRAIYANDRQKQCGVMPCSCDAGLDAKDARDGRTAAYFGVLMCNSVHACAFCSSRIRAEKATKIIRAIAVGEEQYPRATWGMLTLTIRHDGSEPLLSQRKGLMSALRRMRQRGSVQRIWKKRIFASVRAIEVKHGAHGWHPHLHLLVLTTEWTDDERRVLNDAWRDAVLDELGESAEPDEFIGVRWSAPRKNSGGAAAQYLAKLGLEMTHIQNKGRDHAGGRTQWDIGRDAAREMKAAQERARKEKRFVVDVADLPNVLLWREYERAMKGVRCIEMDDRMAAMAKRGAEKVAAEEVSEEIGEPAPSVRVRLDAIDFRAIRRVEKEDPLVLRKILDAASRAGPLEARAIVEHIDEYLSSVPHGGVAPGEFVRRWEIREDEIARGRKIGAESQFRQQDRFVDIGGGFIVEKGAIRDAV